MKTEFRKNARLTDYDYTADGYYFVTVVTRNRLPFLKNCSGECEFAIRNLPQFIKGLVVDYFVVMDDHIHVIFIFEGCARPLGRVVAAMKSAITKIVANPQNVAADVNPRNVAAGVSPQNKGDSHRPLQLWQWNYYEHVIRTGKALSKIREYIQNNPEAGKLDLE